MDRRLAAAAAAVILTLGSFPAAAQAARFRHDDAIVRALRYSAWEAGTLFSTGASPYVRADMDGVAARLEESAYGLSAQARDALHAYRAASPFGRFDLGAGMSLDASIGASLAWYPQIDVAGSPTSSWGWAERLPLVELPLALYVGEALKLEGSLELKEDHNAIRNDMVPANGSTLIEDARYIDYTFPFRALASWERSPVSASMGRDTLRWGPGQSGTLLVSDEPDFYDYLQYGFSSPVLAYRFLWLSLDGALANNDYYPDTIAYSSVPWTKNLFVHRWDITLFKRLYFGIVEGLMVGGVPLDIAYFNPLLILHNRYAWNSRSVNFVSASSAFGLELRFNPWRYMELYGSFLMNQLQTSFEVSTYDGADSIPNAFGWLAGIDAAYPAGHGWFRAGFELAYTNPWLYIRENRFNSFYWRRQLASNTGSGGQGAESSLGYRYGPDCRLVLFHAGWDAPGFLRVDLSCEYREKGANRLFVTSYAEGAEAASLTAPSGIVERTVGVSAGAEWDIRPGLSVSAGMDWSLSRNFGNVGGATSCFLDFAIGVTVSFPR